MDPFEKRLRDVVATLSYKAWSFVVEKDGIGLWNLKLVFTSPHSVTLEPTLWSSRKWRLSMHMTDDEIVLTALKAVLTAEEHEARERFCYRGRPIFGPHISIERLWELIGDPEALVHREHTS